MNRRRIERINRIEEEITALTEELRKEERRGAFEEKAVVVGPLTVITVLMLAAVVSALSSIVMIGA